jgi:hypothetical protein
MSTLTLSYTFPSSAQGWSWTSTTGGTYLTAGWTGSDGNPAGCLAVVQSGAAISESDGRWSLGGTWESFGVPAFSTITQVQITNIDEEGTSLVAGGAAGPYELSDGSTSQATILASNGFDPGTTAWASRSGSAVAVPTGLQPSSSTIAFWLLNSLGAPGNGGGTVSLDNLSIKITYTTGGPPASPRVMVATSSVAQTMRWLD